MKKLLSMKKLIFIATMFLISVSANSQIIDVSEFDAAEIEITLTNGKKNKVRFDYGELLGWRSSYILIQISGEHIYILDSKGEIIRPLNELGWPSKVIKTTPKYFIIRTKEYSRVYDIKFDNKGERMFD